MNVPRRLLGKLVEIQWCDPNFKREELIEIKRGRAALVTWKEYGIVYDVTDGVVLIAHSMAGDTPEETNEIARTAVPEVLIEKIVVFEPTREGT